jgi:hypothetical protein
MQGFVNLVLGVALIVAGLGINDVALTVIGFLLMAILTFRIAIHVVAIRTSNLQHPDGP